MTVFITARLVDSKLDKLLRLARLDDLLKLDDVGLSLEFFFRMLQEITDLQQFRTYKILGTKTSLVEADRASKTKAIGGPHSTPLLDSNVVGI